MTFEQFRDRALFTVGLAGIIGLAVLWWLAGRTPEPTLLTVFVGMAGLPAVLPRKEDR